MAAAFQEGGESMSLAEVPSAGNGLESLIIFLGLALLVLLIDRIFLRLAMEEE